MPLFYLFTLNPLVCCLRPSLPSVSESMTSGKLTPSSHPQLRFELHQSVQKSFLNMCGEQNRIADHSRASVSPKTLTTLSRKSPTLLSECVSTYGMEVSNC